MLSRADLTATGLTDRQITDAVRRGRLLRPRGGRYLPLDAPADIVDACSVGGRLACVSELKRHGVFVTDTSRLHVHLPSTSARLGKVARPVRHHWGRLRRLPHTRAVSVELFDALLQSVLCQSPRDAIATLDSALHLRVLPEDELDEFFAALPRRYRRLRPLLDARCESGPESLVRLMLRSLGVKFEVQVQIDGVGRVDFLVEGWLIVECDSRAHHSEWTAQRRDRRRDQAAAARGFATFRPIAQDILWQPDDVRQALSGLVRAGRPRVRR